MIHQCTRTLFRRKQEQSSDVAMAAMGFDGMVLSEGSQYLTTSQHEGLAVHRKCPERVRGSDTQRMPGCQGLQRG